MDNEAKKTDDGSAELARLKDAADPIIAAAAAKGAQEAAEDDAKEQDTVDRTPIPLGAPGDATGATVANAKRRKANKSEKAPSRDRQVQKQMATERADADAARMPAPQLPVKLVSGKTPTLAELRRMNRERDRELADRNRDIVKAVATTTMGVLKGGVGDPARRVMRRAQAEIGLKAADRRGE